MSNPLSLFERISNRISVLSKTGERRYIETPGGLRYPAAMLELEAEGGFFARFVGVEDALIDGETPDEAPFDADKSPFDEGNAPSAAGRFGPIANFSFRLERSADSSEHDMRNVKFTKLALNSQKSGVNVAGSVILGTIFETECYFRERCIGRTNPGKSAPIFRLSPSAIEFLSIREMIFGPRVRRAGHPQ